MTTPATPSNPTPAGDDRNLVAVDPTTAVSFEDKMQLFWKKNRTVIFILCAVILLAIVAREGWQYMARQKNMDVEKAYAAATTSDQLRSFAAAHPNHALAGIAQLRLADDAYKAGKSADAIAGYDKAISILKEGPLVSRAQIGRALAKIQSGKAGDGQSDLKKLADDTKELKAVRTEAMYHLTSLAVDAGNATDAQKFVDQLMQLDPSSPWTQRALAIRATIPATAEKPAAAASTAPAAKSDTPAAKKTESSGVQVKIPNK
jgi:hypothetical protein